MIIADHGNADNAVNADGSPNTAHSLNPVPFVVYDPRDRFAMAPGIEKPGLGNNASTIINLLGYEAPDIYLPSLVIPK